MGNSGKDWLKRAGIRITVVPALIFFTVPSLAARENPPAVNPYASPGHLSTSAGPRGLEVTRGEETSLPAAEGTGWIQSTDMELKEMAMVAGRSHLLRLQRGIARVSLSNPGVVDAVALSPKEVVLNAKQRGSANVILWDHHNHITVLDIEVTRNPEVLGAILKRIAPRSELAVHPSGDVFVVKGEVETAAQQREIERAANAFAAGSVSLVTLKQARQVLLKIRFVELNHSRGFDFGVDVEHHKLTKEGTRIRQRFLPGGTSAETTGATTVTGNLAGGGEESQFDVFDRNDEDLYQFIRFGSSSHMQGFLKAVESQGAGKIIARPNLLASDGEEASFLVGGEAAVVAVSSQTVGVEYREFGTRLTFMPQILPDGGIRLNVTPEVSALDFANGVTVSGVVIPSFSTVRTETVVELGDGETLMIGGLLQQNVTTSDTGVPFLRRLPLIGKLFNNTRRTTEDKELIVLITPVLVEPLKKDMDEETQRLLETAAMFHETDEVMEPQREAVRRMLGDRVAELAEWVERIEGDVTENRKTDEEASPAAEAEHPGPAEEDVLSVEETQVSLREVERGEETPPAAEAERPEPAEEEVLSVDEAQVNYSEATAGEEDLPAVEMREGEPVREGQETAEERSGSGQEEEEENLEHLEAMLDRW